MQPGTETYIRLMRSPLRRGLYLFAKLPSAFLCGVRIRRLDPLACEVTVPYRWLTRNPFRSTYFACLAMAAELSTGALAMARVYGRRPAVSLLIVSLEATFLKKATGVTRFRCENGEAMEQAVAAALQTGEAQVCTATSTGFNDAGEKIAAFSVTWSFKARKSVT
ncbi:MAG TPA: DUF4442 domain-containing protein [Chitinophagaceae bacterium]|nr:DUF4442 domain-containing protein [Chitinophagaceae bacterium]